ncbi:2-oxo-4-hydroxy-4-carboxy-5-ureidoimidazoline decarboxylase [Deinococcus sonorensis]|uniref:2-oxo-4-hydroxy-4-carboxy-5-ureidoimidazoline decarboxylase n=2 Tax=Deinococcus sonorensis TaxID=309891 RepID=A0AAU7UDJ9_9DEIO
MALATKRTLEQVNGLTEPEFVAMFGAVLEHSPAYARRAWAQRPFESAEVLAAAFRQAVQQDDPAAQMALIRAHPDLAGKAALAGELTAESAGEQRSAGLDRLSPDEYERFHRTNAAYHEKFGIPFVVCVREHTKDSILEQAERRLTHTPEQERQAALDEVAKIARLRVLDLMEETP